MGRREGDVPKDERRAAAFIRNYEEVCRRHGAMVIMTSDHEAEYDYFVVVLIEDWEEDGPVLEQALEEMRLKSPVYMDDIEQEEDDDEAWRGNTD